MAVRRFVHSRLLQLPAVHSVRFRAFRPGELESRGKRVHAVMQLRGDSGGAAA